MRIAFNLFLPGNILIGTRDGGCRLINKKILCCRCLIFGCQPTHGRHVFFHHSYVGNKDSILSFEDLSQHPFVDMMSDAYGFVQDVRSILRKFMSVLPIYADASDVVAPAGLFLPPASPLFYDLTGIHILIKVRSPP